MPTKMGRPFKADSARTEKIGIRITPEDKELIQECADLLGVTRADAIVYCIKEQLKRLKK